MEINEQLFSKNGIAISKIAKELLGYSIGDRIPTISEFSSSLHLVRGTTHNALRAMVDAGAIRIESRGQLGSYLTRKNTKLLLKLTGIKFIVGAMPLPYSKRYEGLASGLIATMENNYGIPVSLTYMRGAMNRISLVIQGRYDFAIVSKFAAESFQKKYDEIQIVMGFGPKSYLSSHVLMFCDPNCKEIKDGMSIGIDDTSIDQKMLTHKVCEGINVQYVPMEYSKLIENIRNGSIDATVMNIDEADDKHYNINYQEIPDLSLDNTEAVIVVRKEATEISNLLQELISRETVLNIQRLVLEGKITPNY